MDGGNDFMDDLSFDVNEIKESGTFGFDNDFELDDDDEAQLEQPFEEEEPAQEFNMPLQTGDSQDSGEEGGNMNDVAIDHAYGGEQSDSDSDANMLGIADENEETKEPYARSASIF